jgi:putative transposon-encoded protein
METSILKEVLEGKAELIRKTVKNHRCSGAVYLPKKYIGKEVIVIVRNENEKSITVNTSSV